MAETRYQFITPSDPLFQQVRSLRYRIMREPLGIPYSADWDDLEAGASHLVAVSDGSVIGYGRVIVRSDGAQIRHMCVSETLRGGGVGSGLVHNLVERARKQGAQVIWLNARFNALDFYRKLGFVETSAFFNSEETSLPHKRMEYRG